MTKSPKSLIERLVSIETFDRMIKSSPIVLDIVTRIGDIAKNNLRMIDTVKVLLENVDDIKKTLKLHNDALCGTIERQNIILKALGVDNPAELRESPKKGAMSAPLFSSPTKQGDKKPN